MTAPRDRGRINGVGLALSALVALGCVGAMSGLWPFGYLSSREAGFDRLGNLFALAPAVPLLWGYVAIMRPKWFVILVTSICTLAHLMCYLFI